MSTTVANADVPWGKGILQYSKTLDPKFLEINSHLPPLPDLLFHPDLPPALLVRESYPKIYEYVKQQLLNPNSTSRGLVVIGQPGIGKTAFLFYALVRALHEGLDVNWCHSQYSKKWLSFVGGDVTSHLEAMTQRRLAFYDQIPPGHDSENTYIVQATIPKRSRYRDWAKQTRARYWVMQSWSPQEIDYEAEYRKIDINDSSLNNIWHKSYSPQQALEIIGPNARRCFDSRPNSGDPIRDFDLESEVRFLFVPKSDALRLVLRILGDADPSNHSFPLGFHETFFVRNVVDSLQPRYNDRLEYYVPTECQLKVIRLQILKETLELDLHTASIFSTNRAIGRYIFESFVQRFLVTGNGPLNVFVGPSSSSIAILPPSNTVDYDPRLQPTPAIDTLYSPVVPNFPSLDFFFLSKDNEIVLVQTTISQKHTENGGVAQIIKYIRSHPTFVSGLKKLYFIFAAPDSASGLKLVSARSVNGEMTVSRCKIKVGYFVVTIGERAVMHVLRKFSIEKPQEVEEEPLEVAEESMDTDA